MVQFKTVGNPEGKKRLRDNLRERKRVEDFRERGKGSSERGMHGGRG